MTSFKAIAIAIIIRKYVNNKSSDIQDWSRYIAKAGDVIASAAVQRLVHLCFSGLAHPTLILVTFLDHRIANVQRVQVRDIIS